MSELLHLIAFSLLLFFPGGILLALFALLKRSTTPLIAGGYLFIAVIASVFALNVPRMLGFHYLQWNWAGKFLDFLWPFAAVYLVSWLNAKEVGIRLPNHWSGWLLGVIFGVFFAIVNVALSDTGEDVPKSAFNLESVLYQFTMPGLAEEITIRGIYLGILNHFLGRPWKLLGSRFGFGAIVVTLIFMSSHVIAFRSEQLQFLFNLEWIDPFSVWISVALIYLREKTESIWPCVIFHNLSNGLALSLAWLLSGLDLS